MGHSLSIEPDDIILGLAWQLQRGLSHALAWDPLFRSKSRLNAVPPKISKSIVQDSESLPAWPTLEPELLISGYVICRDQLH